MPRHDLAQYRKQLALGGPEGVLEAAERDLSEDDLKRLEKDVRAARREAGRYRAPASRRKARS